MKISDEIKAIKRLVMNIIQSKETIFHVKESYGRKYVSSTDNNKILDYYFSRFTSIDICEELPVHKFDPYVKLFIKNLNDDTFSIPIQQYLCGYYDYTTQQLVMPRTQELVNKTVDTLNRFIDSIRQEAASKEFKQRIWYYQRLSKKNYRSLMKYIDNLFMRHGRLLVLRVDLHYLYDDAIPFMATDKIYQKYWQVKKDREHFFNNMRSNKFFDNLLGYAWKLEYGTQKGFHYHMMFFFQGAKVQEDSNLAMKIGKYWTDVVTKGRGLYYNCNRKARKDTYDNLGIGMINHYDTELIENLKKAAHYLAKTDYVARLFVLDEDGKKGRTFGKSEMKERTTHSGRPRNQIIDIQQKRYASEIILIEQLVNGIIESQELFYVCDDKVKNRYYIDANDDFMRDALKKILKYKNKTPFIEGILSSSVHPTVMLFMRNMKDKLVGCLLYTHWRNLSKLKDYDVRVLNEFIESIRHEADSPEFKKAINDYCNRPVVS